MPEKFGVPTDEQLKKINKLAKRKLTAEEVFVWPGKLAGDMIIPDRYVQLTKELLDVFATNAQKGVSFLLDHSWHADGLWGLGGRPKAAIPYGRTFDSSYGPATEEGETVSLNADSYMKRGIEIDGIKTDDLIESIESGTLFDTSIGFNFSKGVCSVCGMDYYNSDDCSHYAGKTYEVEDDDGNKEEKLCWVKARPPGSLWENSGVFDGAYPGAGIMSAAGDILENEHGIYQVVNDLKDIDPSKPIIATYSPRVGLLTMVKKANHKKLFAVKGLAGNATASSIDRDSIFAIGERIGVSREQVHNIANLVLKGDESTMKLDEKTLKMLDSLGIAFKEGETKAEDVFNQLAEKWDKEVRAAEEAAQELQVQVGEVEEFISSDKAKEALGKECSADEILKLAKEGTDYRNELINDTLEWGVRAQGNSFKKETWEALLSESSRTLQAIKDFRDDFKAQAEGDIPDGKKTSFGAGGNNTQNTPVPVPDEYFKA
jgi:hypothetical protein